MTSLDLIRSRRIWWLLLPVNSLAAVVNLIVYIQHGHWFSLALVPVCLFAALLCVPMLRRRT